MIGNINSLATGSCAKAQLQLVVVGVLNIVTDVMLLAVPIPLFFSLKTSWKRKLKLYVLFTLGIFIVAITVIRLPINTINKDSQINRTTWASIELLTATIVVNAPTIYGLWNKKKQSSAYSNSHGTGLPSHSSRKNGTGVRTFNDGTGSQAFAMKSMNHERDPNMGGIMQTQEVIVSEYIDPSKKGPAVRTDEAEIASNSSQRGILRD